MSMDLLERLFSLTGKMALITGGCGGIGRLMAETYAEVGATVVVVARSEESCRAAAKDISRRFGVKAVGKTMDVSDSAKVSRIVEEAVRELGQMMPGVMVQIADKVYGGIGRRSHYKNEDGVCGNNGIVLLCYRSIRSFIQQGR
jgi:NAD(P)-dependent dehydrogenase (short-subunit alcohol dehydrogenase family)